MLIKSLKLYNIRSYKDAQIDFPDGSLLLSGDIGAGKSTILLAMEFALFGIKRGELSGSALLRHGAKEAYVELLMDIEGKEVLVKRALKRGSGDIQQAAGFILVDGVKTEATAVELKARVLELLGYPKELLAKSKDLIYRFTVYTPQEEMKTILFENSDLRLDTLRKLFGIDKYKRVRENAAVYIKELKDRMRDYEGKTFGLEDKIEARKEKEEETQRLKKKLVIIMPELKKLREQLNQKKQELAGDEERIKLLQKYQGEFTVNETRLMDKYYARKKNNEQIEKIEKQLAEMKKEIKLEEIDFEKIASDLKKQQKMLAELENEMLELNKNINEANVKLKQSAEVKDKITKIDKCPLCEQGVSHEHKQAITIRENKVIEQYSLQKKQAEAKKSEANEKIISMKKSIEELQENQKKAAVLQERAKGIREKEKTIENLEKENSELKKEIGSFNAKKIELKKKIEQYKGIEELYEKSRKEIDDLMKKEKEIDIQKTQYETSVNEAEKTIKLYDNEIGQKEKFKKAIKRIASIRNWLEEHFLNLMVVMEKHIMVRLHREFNELFTEWFRILISDETIYVRLDDQFTPVIEQNGYETELANLSGGEKTSIALAYRLSLNKVINDFITHIKTRDIIILDEPTDGFSDDQLDKVRDVLEQINARQVIIVSHEAKIESFVDNIIRVDKAEHRSVVSS